MYLQRTYLFNPKLTYDFIYTLLGKFSPEKMIVTLMFPTYFFPIINIPTCISARSRTLN